MTFKYDNPVSEYAVGDVVRIGSGKVEWTIVGKGATSGLALENAQGKRRNSHTHLVSLVRKSNPLPKARSEATLEEGRRDPS